MNTPQAGLHATALQQERKVLHLPTVGAQFTRLAEQAVHEKQSHLVSGSVVEGGSGGAGAEQRQAPTARCMRSADGDSRGGRLLEITWVSAAEIRALTEGGCVERAEPVLSVGESRTGKPHLMIGLCVAACQQKRRVRFGTTERLVNECVEVKQQLQVRRVLAGWFR
jgi:hypothetical protein